MSDSRFTTPTPDDQQPALWVMSTIGAIYAVCVLGIRFALGRRFKPSDLVLVAAYGMAMVCWALTWASLQHGAGKSTRILTSQEYASGARLTYASIIFLIVAEIGSHVSQCLLLSELVSSLNHKWTCYGAAVVTIITGVASAVVVTAGCSSERYLNGGRSTAPACESFTARWVVGVICLMLSSAVPTMLPPWLFRSLQVKFSRKVGVYSAFSASIFNIPILAVALHFFEEFNSDGQDGLGAANYLTTLQVSLCWSLMAATVGCLRPIAMKFTTSGALVMIDPNSSAARTRADRSMNRTLRSQVDIADTDLRPDQFEVKNHIVGGSAGDNASVISYGSERQFIKKTTVTVQTTVRQGSAARQASSDEDGKSWLE